MRKILVPFDDSDGSRHALAFAVDIAARMDTTEIHIVNAHDDTMRSSREAAYHLYPELKQMRQAQSETMLHDAVASLSKDNKTSARIKTAVLSGDISHVIAEYAQKHGCDHIVMGTHGRGSLGTIFLGSVAQRVIHLSTVPVTLIK